MAAVTQPANINPAFAAAYGAPTPSRLVLYARSLDWTSTPRKLFAFRTM